MPPTTSPSPQPRPRHRTNLRHPKVSWRPLPRVRFPTLRTRPQLQPLCSVPPKSSVTARQGSPAARRLKPRYQAKHRMAPAARTAIGLGRQPNLTLAGWTNQQRSIPQLKLICYPPWPATIRSSVVGPIGPSAFGACLFAWARQPEHGRVEARQRRSANADPLVRIFGNARTCMAEGSKEQVSEEHDGRQQGEQHAQDDGQAAAVDPDPWSCGDSLVPVGGTSGSAAGVRSNRSWVCRRAGRARAGGVGVPALGCWSGPRPRPLSPVPGFASALPFPSALVGLGRWSG